MTVAGQGVDHAVGRLVALGVVAILPTGTRAQCRFFASKVLEVLVNGSS